MSLVKSQFKQAEQESEVSIQLICKAKRCDFLLEPEEDVIFGGTVYHFNHVKKFVPYFCYHPLASGRVHVCVCVCVCVCVSE